MGTVHAAAYAGMADVSVVGVFSRNKARAQAAAARCDAEAFGDVAALIGRPDIDAIDVCLPSPIHHDAVMAALAAGRHVFCESPLALDLGEAQQMRDAARRTGRLLQVGLLMRSVGAYRHIKAITASGQHGRLLSVTTWRLGSYLHAEATDPKAHYGEPSTELMTFDFDFVQWVMGAPKRLSATAARSLRGDKPGEISAVLDYEDGRHATVIASGLMPPGSPFTVGFRALFEGAVYRHQNVFEGGPPKSSFTVVEGRSPGQPVAMQDRDPYQVELQHFVDCIQSRADPALLDADRAIEALVLSTATQRSLSEHRAVDGFTSA